MFLNVVNEVAHPIGNFRKKSFLTHGGGIAVIQSDTNDGLRRWIENTCMIRLRISLINLQSY